MDRRFVGFCSTQTLRRSSVAPPSLPGLRRASHDRGHYAAGRRAPCKAISIKWGDVATARIIESYSNNISRNDNMTCVHHARCQLFSRPRCRNSQRV